MTKNLFSHVSSYMGSGYGVSLLVHEFESQRIIMPILGTYSDFPFFVCCVTQFTYYKSRFGLASIGGLCKSIFCRYDVSANFLHLFSVQNILP